MCVFSLCVTCIRNAYLIMLFVTFYIYHLVFLLLSLTVARLNWRHALTSLTLHSGPLVRKTPLPKCNWREMTAWVPIHAPNLWGHPSRESASPPCTMHADHPWNVTLLSCLFPSGSLTVVRPTASSTPHAWALGDLGLSLTDNWSVAWKPPFSVHLYCWVAEARGLHALPWCRPLLGSPYLWT